MIDYEPLKAGDIIREGDEWYKERKKAWIVTGHVGLKVPKDELYRRPLRDEDYQ
jgi:hypothetical protein